VLQRAAIPASPLSFGQLTLDEVKEVKNKHGVTVMT